MTWPELFERLARIPGGFSLGVHVEFRPAKCRTLPPAEPSAVETTGESVDPTPSNIVRLRRAS